MIPARGEDAEEIALAALAFLASDRERFERFLALSGLSVEGLRAAAAEPGFFAGVLDHVAADEALLLAFAETNGMNPVRIAAAHAALSRGRGAEVE